MFGQYPPYPGDSLLLDRFRNGRQPFFTVDCDPVTAVVLGCGTPVEPDVAVERCAAAKMPIFRRKGGGGAVVLAPGTIVVSGCFPPVPGRFPEVWSAKIVALLAEALVASLASEAPTEVFTRGLGDLCFHPAGDSRERKFLGSSLYIAKDVVLYQASLLYRADLELIPRYLGPPSRTPEYRQGRSHLDFVANLPPEWELDASRMSAHLNARVSELIL